MTRYANTSRSRISGTASDTRLLAANPSRKTAIIYNGGSTALMVALGSTAATATDFTTQVAAGAVWETPTFYLGEVRGLWSGVPTGSAQVTEIT